ncbi:glycosyltransferase family 2 protein [Polaromonas sp.]|uniref:glycosyltransferase family 2 protein n=1 Tax=Polaromonas sp. TaxID=1869339 RepID=UPI0025F6A124|nr:glycosyltransferase family 2 protein [Polaromonas sp.]
MLETLDISLVVPAYNEAGNIELFLRIAVEVLDATGRSYEIIVVNDGSKDDTLKILLDASRRFPSLRVIDLSRNFGKEAAMMAGLDVAVGKAVIPIDADLQHPPQLIPTMLQRWEQGYDVVLCRRSSRNTDRWAQRWFSTLFYRFHNALAEHAIPPDVGDFRLLDRKVVDALRLLPERRRFMKGIFSWVGFRSTIVEFEVEPRYSGKSSFSGWKLWNLALEGITSFSTVPLRIWTYVGGIVSIVALSYAAKVVITTIISGTDLPGYPSLLSAILFLGGVQLIGIGVLGEYIGRIYSEVKQRPIYVVRSKHGFPPGD